MLVYEADHFFYMSNIYNIDLKLVDAIFHFTSALLFEIIFKKRIWT